MYEFNENELTELTAQVIEAERYTSGEIVPYIAQKADAYLVGGIRFVGSFFISGLLLFFLFFGSALAAKDLLFFQLAAIVLAFLVVKFFPVVKLWFLTAEEKDKLVKDKAVKVFYEQGIYKTKEATGILIALFLLEKRVEIIGDTGINSLLAQQDWDEAVKLIIDEAKGGRVAAGLKQGIKRCGEILSAHFPMADNGKNELKNNLIIERS